MESTAARDGRPEVPLLPTGRLEAFSDGIIAIAATLLVLELHVPEPGDDVVHALVEQLRRSLVGPALYGVSVLVGLVSAPAALVVAALIPVYFTITPRHLRRPVAAREDA